MLESDIQRTILHYLSLKGIFHYRNNTGGIPLGKEGGFRPSRSKGAPDIIGMLDGGKFLGIEVKRPGNKPTPEQQAFLDDINARGGLGFVAYSVEDVVRHLEPQKRIKAEPGKTYRITDPTEQTAHHGRPASH